MISLFLLNMSLLAGLVQNLHTCIADCSSKTGEVLQQACVKLVQVTWTETATKQTALLYYLNFRSTSFPGVFSRPLPGQGKGPRDEVEIRGNVAIS